MKIRRELICIGCPLGCPVTVEMEEDQILSVTGNTCKNGDAYARKEVTDPRRTVTSTIAVEGAGAVVVPVKTKSDIPKGKIFACMEEIRRAKVKVPVHMGDVLIEDVAGTGVAVIATKTVEK